MAIEQRADMGGRRRDEVGGKGRRRERPAGELSGGAVAGGEGRGKGSAWWWGGRGQWLKWNGGGSVWALGVLTKGRI